MPEPLVYIDTNILSRIPDLRVPDSTAAAYAELTHVGGIRLVTSEKTLKEILETKNKRRNQILQFLFSLFEKVPYQLVNHPAAIGSAPIGAAPIAGSWRDNLHQELSCIFSPDDAEHIVQAVRSGCSYFLTLDETSILLSARQHASRVAQLCPHLRFVSPEELVAYLKRERRII